jgi:hypothetical protein
MIEVRVVANNLLLLLQYPIAYSACAQAEIMER